MPSSVSVFLSVPDDARDNEVGCNIGNPGGGFGGAVEAPSDKASHVEAAEVALDSVTGLGVEIRIDGDGAGPRRQGRRRRIT